MKTRLQDFVFFKFQLVPATARSAETSVVATIASMPAKITGMFLELDQAEMLRLIKCPDTLRLKVQEAKTVLKAGTVQVACS